MAEIDVYCVSDDHPDVVMWIDSALTPSDVPIKNVADMVFKLVARFGTKVGAGDCIGELRIVGHGNEYGQYMGSDWIDNKSIEKFRPQFSKLMRLFGRNGLITLGGCRVGRNGSLLVKLSDMTNVPVRAFTASQRPAVPGDEGNETKCYITCARSSGGNLWDFLERK
jgi:Domain of unknown function (DUF4347)